MVIYKSWFEEWLSFGEIIDQRANSKTVHSVSVWERMKMMGKKEEAGM